mmetsp:Transcript_42722/g.68578  ORF Transcript_42722/g.68578 Transcript_42722/m.68578 type:complete len:109 (+) Transcript_42722:589-915(+)
MEFNAGHNIHRNHKQHDGGDADHREKTYKCELPPAQHEYDGYRQQKEGEELQCVIEISASQSGRDRGMNNLRQTLPFNDEHANKGYIEQDQQREIHIILATFSQCFVR